MKPYVISEEHEIISLNRSQLPSPISKSQIEADILERLFNFFFSFPLEDEALFVLA